MSKPISLKKIPYIECLKEFIEEMVQNELMSKVEQIVKNYLEKEDIDIEKLKKCVNKVDAKIIMKGLKCL